jgi:hypothetical protein
VIGQTIVGEVEEDRLIFVHVAWNVGGPLDHERAIYSVDFFLQDWQCDVYADLGWAITESLASVSLRGCLADAPPTLQGPIPS